ncbi:glycosyltransferase family 2 protein [Saccharolobus solfataricus]|uniref:Glycosyltransferase family 2 protein n=1 Tax=Saccharolobus solfataricus TaxID=2287 RepID=A0A7S9IHC7_SACSO|nr:glycosyltransferase family 2 protein [Saccharolobus solfataricus]QPG49192.1 glycosyltransferase family 2 protein [Saccharolobus solfataricus]
MSSKISVIITAHNRRKYILDALGSVINNNLPKDKLEIIVVKNYKDDVIDSEIDRLSKLYNVISLIENDFRLGAKISRGIKNCSGDVITFLEDDDLYLPDRLSNILQIFSNNNIIFYHNMIEIIGNRKIDEIVSDYRHGQILVCENKRKIWKQVASTEAKFNLSSMALRANLLSSWIDLISRINFAVDNALFYISLNEKGCLMIDPRVFTKFRISDKKDYIKNEREFHLFIAEKFYEDYILLHSTFKDSYFNDAIKQGLVFWYLKYRILSEKISTNYSLRATKFLDVIFRNKLLIILYFIALLPYNLRKYIVNKYFIKYK